MRDAREIAKAAWDEWRHNHLGASDKSTYVDVMADAILTAQREAIEEAAKVCEGEYIPGIGRQASSSMAAAIRSLLPKEPHGE